MIVYFHGGGFVIGSLDAYDASARALGDLTGAIVISVDYRLAPENRFPSAHEDAFAAYRWAVTQAGTYGGDARRIAVAGESAGGNLAIDTAIRARDEGVALPAHQLLIYPVAGTDLNTPSYLKYANAQPLNRAMMGWFFGYLLNRPSQAADTRLNVVAADLRGLPPTTLIAAEVDPLQSEGAQLAQKLREAGTPVEYRLFPGTTHEFFGMAAVVDAAREAQAFAASRLNAALR